MKRLNESIKESNDKRVESKNLMSFFDNKLFIWQSSDHCVYCFKLKDGKHIINFQVLEY